ncbi:MAG TPA: DUF5610 domain-containing protein [Fibrobacteraceae bacterium]|nr:DUF5610 domain-containing protein [Fibrobacteraceae bacterium]
MDHMQSIQNSGFSSSVWDTEEEDSSMVPPPPPEEETPPATEDSYEPSEEAASTSDAQGEIQGKFSDFDMEAFHAEIRDKLLEQVEQAQESDGSSDWSTDDLLYSVGDDVEAADVPEEYNADNTAQRIVDFALQFRDLAPELSDEEYIEEIRAAIQEGFSQAQDQLGNLPDSSAKLFNDTYEAAMSKLDDVLEEWTSNSES